MALIEIKDPTEKDLKWFGALMLAFFGIVGGVLSWRGTSANVVYGVWGGGAALVAVYYAVPALQRKIFFGWLYAAYPIGFVVSHVVMAFVYFIVVTPIALVMRVMGRDALGRRLDREAKTYWVENRTAQNDPASYFRQF
jgi:hypothetical protein